MNYRVGIPGSRHARRLISLLVLIALLAAHVPIPTLAPGKDHSARFPCENRPCGCMSAEQCWSHCCCCTNAEKLAWARENGVTPPAFVVAAAENEAEPETPRSCCAQRATCCAEHDESGGSSCCESSKDSEPLVSEGRERDGDEMKFVIGIIAQHCQGLSSHWLSLPWMVADSEIPVEPSVLVVTMNVSQVRDVPDIADCPPTPPPRVEAISQSC